jgi:hypothetical protein
VQEYVILMTNPARLRCSLCALLASFLLLMPEPVFSVTRTAAEPVAQVEKIAEVDRIEVDGILSEPVWDRTDPIGELRMVEPEEGVPASERTEVRVSADENALFIGIMCFDSAPDRIVSHTMQRDAELRRGDHIKLVFDTFMNGRTGYVFALNPNGARYDALIEKEGERENKQWDGIWEAAVHRSAEGWSAEILGISK